MRQEKKSTKINFLDLETARWGRGLPCEGVVAEKLLPSLESLSSLGFEERNLGCTGNFAGMSRTLGGVQKVCARKVRAYFSLSTEYFTHISLIFRCVFFSGNSPTPLPSKYLPALRNYFRFFFRALDEKAGKSPWGCHRNKVFAELFRGLVRALPSLPRKRGSYRKGALTKINSSYLIFWALAGFSGKSPPPTA